MIDLSPRSPLPLLAATLLVAAPRVGGAMSPSRPAPPKSAPRLRSIPPAQHRVHGPIREPILLELYTSQGSRPCNAAERALTALLRDEELRGRILPLAFHVDYWDGLGHRDPFGSPEYSARQRAYAAIIRGKGGTPWIVLDGRREAPADRLGVLRAAIRRMSHEARAGRIEIETQAASMAVKVHVKGYLRRRVAGHMVDVVVALYEDGLTTRVERGENAGADLRNDRVVRELHVVDRIPTIAGSVTNSSTLIALPANWKGRRFGVVAFLQARPTRIVHAVAGVHFGFAGDLPATVEPLRGTGGSTRHRPL